MEISFWNLCNSKRAIEIISKSDFVGTNRLIAFAEYWEVSKYVQEQLEGRNYWIDDVKKRTGYVCSNIAPRLRRAERYYTHLSIDYNDIEIHIWIVHLKSRLNSESSSISLNANIIKEITDEANNGNCRHSLIIGDFNISHFDEKMFDFFHLNSTHYFTAEDPKDKTFEGNTRIKFYNPIAALSGDLSLGPPGTYFYQKPNQSQAWHTFDMALVSYGLSQYLDKGKCEIVTELNGVTLGKTNGRPNKNISDHFPIRIRLL